MQKIQQKWDRTFKAVAVPCQLEVGPLAECIPEVFRPLAWEAGWERHWCLISRVKFPPLCLWVFQPLLPKKIPRLSLGRVSGAMTLFPAQQLESAALEKDLSCIIHGLRRHRCSPGQLWDPWAAASGLKGDTPHSAQALLRASHILILSSIVPGHCDSTALKMFLMSCLFFKPITLCDTDPFSNNPPPCQNKILPET